MWKILLILAINYQFCQAAPQYYPHYYPNYPYYDPAPAAGYYYPPPLNMGPLRGQVRRQGDQNFGFQFEPQKIMSEAKGAAKMTRGMADLIDTRGKDFLDLLGEYSTEGKKNDLFT